MRNLETLSLFIVITLYGILPASIFLSKIIKSEKIAEYSFNIMIGGFFVHSLAIFFRWYDVGHPPYFTSFENALVGSWFVVLFGLIAYTRWQFFINFNLLAACMAIAILWFGLLGEENRAPLNTYIRGVFIALHVTIAWLAFSMLTIAFIVAIVVITGKGRIHQGLSFLPIHIPAGELAGDIMARYVIYAHVMLMATLMTGSYYSQLVLGRWWQWDPVESLTLGAWLTTTFFLALRRFVSNSIRAWLISAGFIMALISYWFLAYLPKGSTFHIFG